MSGEGAGCAVGEGADTSGAGGSGAWTRRIAAAWSLAGVALLLASPYARFREADRGFWVAVDSFGAQFAVLGAAIAVAGAAAVATGRWRALTPRRAAAAPALTAASLVLAKSMHRAGFVCGVGDTPEIPETRAEVLRFVFLDGGVLWIAAAAFLLVGVATARDQPRWLKGTLGGVVAYGAVYGAANTSVAHGALIWPVGAALVGLVPAVIGYRAATPRSEAPGSVG